MTDRCCSRVFVLCLAFVAACDDDSAEPPADTPEIIKQCLRLNACEADGGSPVGIQTCLARVIDRPWDWASTGARAMSNFAFDCKLAAEDCATVKACDPDVAAFTEICGENGGSDLCVDDTWVVCDFDNQPVFATDCSAAGQSCAKSIWAGCGNDSCEYGVTESSCDPNDPDVLITCTPSGTLARIDCKTQNNFVSINRPDGELVATIAGTTCGYDEQMSATSCIGTGDTCDFFSQRCDGDVLETCSGGKLTRRDCAALEPAGQGCGFITAGEFSGAASCGIVDADCALDDDESCADGKIQYCSYGVPASIDCRAVGYADCGSTTFKERTVAFCTN